MFTIRKRFCVATVDLARHSWWETAALGSAVVGLLAFIPYWIAGTRGGETTGTVAWNATVHLLMVQASSLCSWYRNLSAGSNGTS